MRPCMTPVMCLQIPWTNLGKSAVVVYVDRLYILAGPKIEAASAEDGTYEVSTITAASANANLSLQMFPLTHPSRAPPKADDHGVHAG